MSVESNQNETIDPKFQDHEHSEGDLLCVGGEIPTGKSLVKEEVVGCILTVRSGGSLMCEDAKDTDFHIYKDGSVTVSGTEENVHYYPREKAA